MSIPFFGRMGGTHGADVSNTCQTIAIIDFFGCECQFNHWIKWLTVHTIRPKSLLPLLLFFWQPKSTFGAQGPFYLSSSVKNLSKGACANWSLCPPNIPHFLACLFQTTSFYTLRDGPKFCCTYIHTAYISIHTCNMFQQPQHLSVIIHTDIFQANTLKQCCHNCKYLCPFCTLYSSSAGKIFSSLFMTRFRPIFFAS